MKGLEQKARVGGPVHVLEKPEPVRQSRLLKRGGEFLQ
jgi:hypothetical protein